MRPVEALIPYARNAKQHSDAQVALIVADNRIAENAAWDDELLRLELTDLLEADFDLDLLGWSKDERDYLLAGDEPENQGNTDDDEIPETPANPVSRPGDVWVLGRHRLMCGDCRDYSTV